MLGKLIKHEWKSVYKVECLLLIVMFAFSLVGAIMFQTPMGDFLFENTDYMSEAEEVFWVMTLFSSFFIYIIVMCGVSFGQLIYQGVHFYKSMYTDEGYLSHTLPVTSHQLLFSKVFVGALWTLIIQAAMVICIFFLAFSMIFAADPTIFNEFPGFGALIKEMGEALYGYEGRGVITHYLIAYITAVLMGPFCSIVTVFGALTIGQLSRKYKAMMGIITYFGITFASNVLSNIAQMIGTMTMSLSEMYGEVNYHGTLFFSLDLKLIISGLIAVGMYFLSHYIIERKLNLN